MIPCVSLECPQWIFYASDQGSLHLVGVDADTWLGPLTLPNDRVAPFGVESILCSDQVLLVWGGKRRHLVRFDPSPNNRVALSHLSDSRFGL